MEKYTFAFSTFVFLIVSLCVFQLELYLFTELLIIQFFECIII